MKGIMLLITTLSSFIIPFMGSSVNIALPAISKELHMDAVSLNWVSSSFILSSAMFLVPFGRLADIHGRKRFFTWGVWLYSVATLCAALSGSAAVLILFRGLQGLAGALMFGTGLAILTSVFPLGERGRVLGINAAAVYLGLSLGPFIGGMLTQNLGWRSVFLVTIPLGLLIILLIGLFIKEEWADSRGERFDFTGSAVYSLGLISLMYGFSRLPSVFGTALLLGGICCLVVFIAWELRTRNPLLEMGLFRHNMVFAMSNLSAMINYSATFAVGFLLSLYLQYIKGMNPQSAGFILVSQPIVMSLFSPLAGRMSDRVEPRVVASLGMAFSALGLFSFVFLNASTPIPFVIAGLVVLGFGFALFASPNTNAVMSSVEKQHYGIASGTIGTMRLVGQMFSMGIVMVIFALLLGRVEITPEHHAMFLKSARTAFIAFSALCGAGVFTSMARGRMR